MKNCIIDSKIKIHNSIIASNSKIFIVNNDAEKIFLLGEGTQIM